MLVVFRAFDQGEPLEDDLEIIVVGLLVDLQKDTVRKLLPHELVFRDHAPEKQGREEDKKKDKRAAGAS